MQSTMFTKHYTKVQKAAADSITHHSALYYAVLWGYKDIMPSLIEEAKINHLNCYDALDLASGIVSPPPSKNFLISLWRNLCACCLNLKMRFFRRDELDEILTKCVLSNTLDDISIDRHFSVETEIIKNDPIQFLDQSDTEEAIPYTIFPIELDIATETEPKVNRSIPLHSDSSYTTNVLYHNKDNSFLQQTINYPTNPIKTKHKSTVKQPIGVPSIRFNTRISNYKNEKHAHNKRLQTTRTTKLSGHLLSSKSSDITHNS